jgi:hypothetical protein
VNISRTLRSRRTVVAGLAAAVLATMAGNVPIAAATASPVGKTVAVRDVSGVAMPTTAPAGYTQVLADDFPGYTLSSDWVAYHGQPGSDAGGWWSPTHVVVDNGEMFLKTYEDTTNYGGPSGYEPWVSGGVSSAKALKQTYGEYLVRSRLSAAAPATEVDLLWPAGGGWPPEIDFNESNDSTVQTSATLHWGPTNTQRNVQLLKNINMTAWHTWGLIWAPGQITYTIDGKVWATVSSSEVPDVPMVLDIQQQVWGCNNAEAETCPEASAPAEVDMDVAWVVAYAPAG